MAHGCESSDHKGQKRNAHDTQHAFTLSSACIVLQKNEEKKTYSVIPLCLCDTDGKLTPVFITAFTQALTL